MNSTDYQVNLLRERIRELETRMLQLEDRVVFYPPAQPQQEPVAGKGKELSEQLKLCARNVAFVAAGRVDMSSAAMQEMFALIDHVCVGLDSSPASKPLTDEMDKRASHIEDYSRRDWFITGWLQAEAAHGIKS